AGADALNAIAARVTSADVPKAERIEEAGKLIKVLGAFMAVTGDVYPPRVPAIRALLVQLRDAFKAETDREIQDALAATLAAFHQAAHEIYKVDENARSNATQQFRERPGNEAANYAAQDRIIYPTTRAHRDTILKTGTLDPESTGKK
ncbi:MAG TPA: hypothetical protein VKE40_16385, partial [Gemmataceae bacterium]|nr:hypothetical protein [Gemmataceae bacterium]